MNKIITDKDFDGLVEARHLKFLSEYETTTNRHVYNVSKKRSLEYRGLIHCSRCPYHRIENYKHKPQKSWKEHRDTQYKSH